MDFNSSVLLRYICCLFFFLLCVKVCDSGECCRSHYDRLGFWRHDVWCIDYCCSIHNAISYKLYCCSDPSRRAGDRVRDNFCSAWFTHPSNIWVPILIGIICLAILISLCGCCFCFCC